MKRWLWVGLILAMTAVVTPRALAHTELVSATPAPGSSVQALTEIRLAFSEPVGSDVRIDLMQDFVPAAELTPVLDPDRPNVVFTAVPPLPNGVYTVQWAVTSVDGHPISGSYSLGINSTPPQPDTPWHQTLTARLAFLLSGVFVVGYTLVRSRPKTVSPPKPKR